MSQGLQITSQAQFEETDYSAAKIVLFALMGLASAVAAVYEFDQFLVTQQYAFLIFSLIAAFVFTSINILNAFFLKRLSILWGIVFLETLGPLALFIPKMGGAAPYGLLAGFGLLFAFSFLGIMRARGVLKNSVKIKFFRAARVATPKLVTGILICAGIIAYTEYFSWNRWDVSMGRTLTYGIVAQAEPFAHLWFPGVSGTQKTDEFLRAVTVSQLDRLPPTAIPGASNLRQGLEELPAETKEAILVQLTNEFEKALETKIGPIDRNATVRDTVYDALARFADARSAQEKRFGGIALLVLLFFSVRGIAALFQWVINGFAFMLYKFLLAADFAMVSFEARNREFVFLP